MHHFHMWGDSASRCLRRPWASVASSKTRHMQLRLRERRNPDSDRGSVHLADGASAVLVAQVLVFWCFARRSLRPLRALAQSPLHSPWATDPLGAHAVLWPWATDPLGYRTHVGFGTPLPSFWRTAGHVFHFAYRISHRTPRRNPCNSHLSMGAHGNWQPHERWGGTPRSLPRSLQRDRDVVLPLRISHRTPRRNPHLV